MVNIPEIGIGIIYSSGFKNVLESNFDLIDLVEIEPQTFWLKQGPELDSFIFNEAEINYLQSINKPKLFHGVGYPVAGSLPLNTAHIPYLKKMMSRLDPVWLSEHLSFNNIKIQGDICNTNFLLPPLQTPEGARIAIENIKAYRSYFEIPFVFETGVNYLQPYDFELDDGLFVNTIAENSDSYILLDIHNLYANQLNGRQPVLDFVNQINPERIVQIHMAGGFTHKGYYLDAHSGTSNDEVFNLYEKIVKELPNLKAVTFEMQPENLNFVSETDIRKQLEKMKAVWDNRGKKLKVKRPYPTTIKKVKSNDHRPKVKEWETVLGCLAIEKFDDIPTSELSKLLWNDNGISIIQELVKKFRKSLVVSSLKLSCRYLMLKYGLEYLNAVFKDFWQVSKPFLFATENGIAFGQYIIEVFDTQDHVLKDLALYEVNSLKTLLDGEERVVKISFNPYAMIESLSQGKLPKKLSFDQYEITIEADEQNEKEPISLVYHS